MSPHVINCNSISNWMDSFVLNKLRSVIASPYAAQQKAAAAAVAATKKAFTNVYECVALWMAAKRFGLHFRHLLLLPYNIFGIHLKSVLNHCSWKIYGNNVLSFFSISIQCNCDRENEWAGERVNGWTGERASARAHTQYSVLKSNEMSCCTASSMLWITESVHEKEAETSQ